MVNIALKLNVSKELNQKNWFPRAGLNVWYVKSWDPFLEIKIMLFNANPVF